MTTALKNDQYVPFHASLLSAIAIAFGEPADSRLYLKDTIIDHTLTACEIPVWSMSVAIDNVEVLDQGRATSLQTQYTFGDPEMDLDGYVLLRGVIFGTAAAKIVELTDDDSPMEVIRKEIADNKLASNERLLMIVNLFTSFFEGGLTAEQADRNNRVLRMVRTRTTESLLSLFKPDTFVMHYDNGALFIGTVKLDDSVMNVVAAFEAEEAEKQRLEAIREAEFKANPPWSSKRSHRDSPNVTDATEH